MAVWSVYACREVDRRAEGIRAALQAMSAAAKILLQKKRAMTCIAPKLALPGQPEETSIQAHSRSLKLIMLFAVALPEPPIHHARLPTYRRRPCYGPASTA